ncbi:hypothetical protein C8F01DRAFT_344584 [Mycena amicta]|nr:hypothetical protein C8F01DRAFT_344584 [Mycena amicta]
MPSILYLKTLLSAYLSKLFEFFLSLLKPSGGMGKVDTGQEPESFPRPPSNRVENEKQPPIPSPQSLTFISPRSAPRVPHKSPTRSRQRQHFGPPVFEHVVHPRSLMPLEPVINLPDFMLHKVLREVVLNREKIHGAKKQRKVFAPSPQVAASNVENSICPIQTRSHSFSNTRKVEKRHSFSSLSDARLPAIPSTHSSPTLLETHRKAPVLKHDREGSSPVLKHDRAGFSPALMQEAENTTAINAEQIQVPAMEDPGLLSSISTSCSMAALANASSRSISDLLNAFDKVMTSRSWYQLLERSEDISNRRRMEVDALV